MAEQECIFCGIVEGKIPSAVLAETQKAIAVLEINPISKGHILIIPKDHKTKIQNDQEVLEFAQKIASLVAKLNPKTIIPFVTSILEHEILNLLPVYSNETPQSERHKASKEELKEIQKELVGDLPEQSQTNSEAPKEKEPIKRPEPKTIHADKLWLPRRVP